VLKSGVSCNLRWASVPAGVEVVFYNLWGPWSFNSNDCAALWCCYSGPYWPLGCLRGSEPRERWAGPLAASLDDARCAVWIDIQPGFTCAACPDGFFRSITTGAAECLPCSVDECPPGRYRGECGYSSDSKCLPCSVDECPPGRYRGECGYSSDSKCLECPAGTYKTSVGNDINLCTRCPGSTFSRITGSASPASCTQCAAVSACGNRSLSKEGSSSPDECECPFAIAHPLAVTLAIGMTACAAVALLVLQQNARARGAGEESLLAHDSCDTLESAPAETHGLTAFAVECLETAKNECVVCLSGEPVMALMPCGHRCACAECAPMLETCPLCRTAVREAKRIFG